MTEQELIEKYKTINRNNKLLKFIVAAILLVGLWLWYQSCHPNPDEKPTTITVKEQSEVIKVDTIREKHLRDSFTLVLKSHYQKDYQNESYFVRLVNENEELLKENEKLLKPIVQDTCKALDAFWNNKYSTYTTQTQKALTAARTSINGLNQTVSVQKKAMDTKDNEYQKLRRDADTCLKYAAINEKYIKKIAPKRAITAEISMITNYISIKPAFGVGLGYRGKNSLEFNAAIYSDKQLKIGIKRDLVKF